MTMPMVTDAATAGVSAGVSKKITANMNSDTTVSAGVSSALAACIDISTAKATVSAAEDTTTASGQQETVCGYTNLGVAKVEGNLNVREGAGEDAELVGKMPGDAGCEILGTEGEWTQIQSGEVTGYVKSEFLITGEEAKAYAKEVMSTIATCTTETLRVREEPSTESEILALMPEGEEVEVLEDQGDWFKVLVDSEEGYVSYKSNDNDRSKIWSGRIRCQSRFSILCMSVCRQPICMGWHKPDTWSRLFRIYLIDLCKIWYLSATFIRCTGKLRNKDQCRRGTAGRSFLLWKRKPDQPCSNLYR